MKSRKFYPLFSVFRLGLFLAGLSFARIVSAETIVLPEPYSTNVVLSLEAWVQLHPTNIVVFDYAGGEDSFLEWEEFRDTCLDLVSLVRDSAHNIGQESYSMDLAFHGLIHDLEDLPWPSDVPDSVWETWEFLVSNWSEQFAASRASVVSEIVAIYDYCDEVTNELSFVDSLFQVHEVVDSVTFGSSDFSGSIIGGSCNCPDYTVYLQGLHADLVQLRGDLARYFDWLVGFRSGWRDVISSADTSGEIAATLLRQWWEVMRIRPLDEPSSGWDPAENLRNFIRWGFVFPTNTVDHPLWVTSADDEGLSVRIVNTNAIKVSITNDYSGFAITNIEEITTNIYSNSLDHATNDVDAVEDEYGQVEEDRTPLRDTLEIGSVTDSSAAMLDDGWFSAWRDFFSLEFQCPTYVTIHGGWTWYLPQFGSSRRRSRDGSGEVLAEIPFIRWTIDDNHMRVLSFVRACISLFLAFVYIRILIFIVRFDAQLLGLLARIMYSVLVNGRDLPKVSADVVNLWGDFVTSLFGGDEAAYRS